MTDYKRINHDAMRFLNGKAREIGITHKSIAEKLGVHPNGVGRMLHGTHSPQLINFIKICDAIGIKASDVLRHFNK